VKRLFVLLCLVLIVLLPSGHAQVFAGVSNLDEPDGSPQLGLIPEQWLAISFTTASGTEWSLNSAVLRLVRYGTPGPLTVSLNSDASGQPGTPIAQFSSTMLLESGLVNRLFVLSDPVPLTAGETYWIVGAGASSNFDNHFGWKSTDGSGAETGLPGWTLSDHPAVSFNQGSSWAVRSDYPPFKVAINVVPEPGEYALAGGLCLAGFALCRRRGNRWR